MTGSPELLTRSFFEAFPRSDGDVLVGFFSDDAVHIDDPRGTHRGVDPMRTEFESGVATMHCATVESRASEWAVRRRSRKGRALTDSLGGIATA